MMFSTHGCGKAQAKIERNDWLCDHERG
jgi:hypothetical protein